MKIYTKTGDGGNTGLLGGVSVGKDHPIIDTVGAIDELNCVLGVALNALDLARATLLDVAPPVPKDATRSAQSTDPRNVSGEIRSVLVQIQNDLFDLGSRVAAALSAGSRVSDFGPDKSVAIEGWIDLHQEKLPPLTAFILPGGGATGSQLHLARAVCRRAERRLVSMMNQPGNREFQVEQIYLNRLGDLLFVLARAVNLADGVAETRWEATRSPSSP